VERTRLRPRGIPSFIYGNPDGPEPGFWKSISALACVK
jgi:hypothetical protein